MVKRYRDFIYENNNIRPEDYSIRDYVFDNGILNVNKSVVINSIQLTKIPFLFGTINGNFDIRCNQIKSLENSPKEVYGNFHCNENELTSLEHCPEIVNGGFYCFINSLSSLKGCPKVINGDFDCCFNQITSLEGCPEKINGYFECESNELTSLEGCPKVINGFFNCKNNKLTSLKGCPEIINGDFTCDENKLLTSLEYIPKRINGDFTCDKRIQDMQDIEDYPLCIIKGDIRIQGDNIRFIKTKFNEIQKIVNSNEEIFKNLLDNKIKFHQMVMRLDPDLIQYYKNIPPPSKNSNLLV